MSRYQISMAGADDDVPLRALMASEWIEGRAAITLRREPSYFAGCRLRGDRVQTVVVRDLSTGEVVCVGSRCVAPAFIGGVPRSVAYLADLRIHREHRNGTLVWRVFRFLRALHEADPLPTYTLIYDDNDAALGSLVGGRAGLPHYRELGRLTARALHLRGRRPALTLPGVELRRAAPHDMTRVVQFLNERNEAFQWAPVLRDEDFLPGGRCDTLRAEDFFVASRRGRLCGVMAAWDQSGLRQAHIERYPRWTAWMRPAYNLVASIRSRPRLPPAGHALPYVYLSFVSVENDDPAVGSALLRHVYNELCGGPWLYALAALHVDHALLPLLSGYAGSDSGVRLYEVDFDTTGPSRSPPVARTEFALA